MSECQLTAKWLRVRGSPYGLISCPHLSIIISHLHPELTATLQHQESATHVLGTDGTAIEGPPSVVESRACLGGPGHGGSRL